MRVNGIIKRAKVAAVLLFGWDRHVRIMQCERCGSINIAKVNGEYDEIIPEGFADLNVQVIYKEIATCKDCGANVAEKQYWQWNTKER